MKILNIDAYVVPKRNIKVDGVDHPVLPMSVNQFIENLSAQEAIEDGRTILSVRARTEAAIDSLIQIVPTLTRERLGNVSLEALGAMLSFVRGEMDGVGDAPAGVVTDTEEQDAKKA